MTESLALADQHAFVTGGGSGIGLACAAALVADGAMVTIFGRNEERLAEATAGLGEAARYAVGDTSIESDVATAVAAANAIRPVTMGIANAGTGAAGPFLETDLETWHAVLQTNLDGTMLTFKHVGRAAVAAGGGALCAISSIAGLRTHKLMTTYCASKAAIDMLVRNAADELGQQNVRVNSVCPGLVETALSAGLSEHDAMREDYLSCMPVRRLGQPDDIARAVRFLLGPESGWITGVVLPVDGGHHLRRGPNLEVML